MRTEEFIDVLSEKWKAEGGKDALREGTPLGVDVAGDIVLSQTRAHAFTPRHTCVTGARRSVFIRRLLVHLSCLYEKTETNFLVLSPRAEYGELLRLKNADITVPFVRTNADVEQAKACVRGLIEEYARGVGYPKLYLVLDGLEELPKCNENGDLEEYRAFLELVARQKNVEIISGVELMKSIFSGNPGVFVGVGNCLVTTREEGRADVTYVGEDCSLSMPTAMSFPDAPSVLESIIYRNAFTAKNGDLE